VRILCILWRNRVLEKEGGEEFLCFKRSDIFGASASIVIEPSQLGDSDVGRSSGAGVCPGDYCFSKLG